MHRSRPTRQAPQRPTHSWTWRRDTSSAAFPNCPSRAIGHHGACTRTTSRTCDCCVAARSTTLSFSHPPRLPNGRAASPDAGPVDETRLIGLIERREQRDRGVNGFLGDVAHLTALFDGDRGQLAKTTEQHDDAWAGTGADTRRTELVGAAERLHHLDEVLGPLALEPARGFTKRRHVAEPAEHQRGPRFARP